MYVPVADKCEIVMRGPPLPVRGGGDTGTGISLNRFAKFPKENQSRLIPATIPVAYK